MPALPLSNQLLGMGNAIRLAQGGLFVATVPIALCTRIHQTGFALKRTAIVLDGDLFEGGIRLVPAQQRDADHARSAQAV